MAEMKRLIGSIAAAACLLPSALFSEEARKGGPVYVIPINGMIERALVYMVRRGVNEAVEDGARAIIFDMDTPGGRLDAAEEIIRIISSLPMPTYTYVNPNSISAGAIIAMATDHIYMAPGSKIGDAMPIMLSPVGGVQEMPEAIQEKSVSYVAGLIRANAQRKNHDSRLAEAMVRRGAEYKIGDEVINPKDQLLTLTNFEAERMVDDGGGGKRKLLSSGTLPAISDLISEIGGGHAAVVRVKTEPEEKIARWIELLSVFLLIGGALGLYIEFKTPGFGLPGIAGIVLLAVWFWGYHVAGLAGMSELLILLIGFALLLVEVFVFPGFGIAGVAGISLIVAAVFMAMVEHYPGTRWYVPPPTQVEAAVIKLSLSLVASFAAGAILARYLPQNRLFQRLMLSTTFSADRGYQATTQTGGMVGRRGVAVTALRPSGIALFDGKRLNVVARGNFVEANSALVIAEVHGNRIIVDSAPNV